MALMSLGLALFVFSQLPDDNDSRIVAIAGLSLTLPGVLSATGSVLSFAYDLYGQVDIRRERIRILPTRCRDLVARLAGDPTVELPPAIRRCISNMEQCISVVLCHARSLTDSLPT
jgi:hypothetical protein